MVAMMNSQVVASQALTGADAISNFVMNISDGFGKLSGAEKVGFLGETVKTAGDIVHFRVGSVIGDAIGMGTEMAALTVPLDGNGRLVTGALNILSKDDGRGLMTKIGDVVSMASSSQPGAPLDTPSAARGNRQLNTPTAN